LRKLKILGVVLLVAVFIMLILPYLMGGFEWSISDLITLYGLAAVGVLVFLTSNPTPQQNRSMRKVSELGDLKTITSIACYGCEYTEQREFERGDYVGKALGECPKCNGQRYVKSIYAIEEKKK
jgi:predicted nucleic-acid-binding Zn-ribbon protein